MRRSAYTVWPVRWKCEISHHSRLPLLLLLLLIRYLTLMRLTLTLALALRLLLLHLPSTLLLLLLLLLHPRYTLHDIGRHLSMLLHLCLLL